MRGYGKEYFLETVFELSGSCVVGADNLFRALILDLLNKNGHGD